MVSDTARWSGPVQASSAFTDQQAQRVQALRAAREVVEERPAAKGPFTSGGVSANGAYLIEVAEYIVNGTVPAVPE